MPTSRSMAAPWPEGCWQTLGDAELRKIATNWVGWRFPASCSSPSRGRRYVKEDAVLVPIETEGNAVAAQQVRSRGKSPRHPRWERLSNGTLRVASSMKRGGGVVGRDLHASDEAAIEEEHCALPSAGKDVAGGAYERAFLGNGPFWRKHTSESPPYYE